MSKLACFDGFFYPLLELVAVVGVMTNVVMK
jgi:hypothetical protein